MNTDIPLLAFDPDGAPLNSNQTQCNFDLTRVVILDWAGTAVDYGCIGPAAVFVDVFQRFGVAVTMDEARQFMGLMKKDHLRSMCALPRVAARWQAAHGRIPTEADIDALYAEKPLSPAHPPAP